jgi:hypothetical protein
VRRTDQVDREAEAVANRHSAAGQGDETTIVKGARGELYVQATEDHVPVAVLHRSSQGK